MRKFLLLLLALVTVAGAIPTAVLPIFATEAQEGSGAGVTYTHDDLYVQGASFKWDAFDMKATDDAITAFENQEGETDVSLPVTVTMGDGYVLYPYTSSNFNLASLFPKYKVGTRYLPDDYTFEMTVHQHWDESCTAKENIKWAIAGFGTGSSWGGQFQLWTQAPSDTQGSISKVSSMYAVMKEDGSLTDSYNNSKSWKSIFVNLLEKPYTVGWTHDATFSTEATYHPSADVPLRDGALNESLVRNHYLRNAAYDNLNEKGFKIGSYVPFAYYAIRIYPFALKAEEVAQNHFAELCDYHKISAKAVNAYFALDTAKKTDLHNSFVGVTYPDTDTEALENAIFDRLGMMENDRYASLYADGAVFLWNSFLPGTVINGYFANLLDGTVLLGDGTATVEEESGYGYTAYAGRLDFTSLLQKEDGTYGDALELAIGLRLTADYGNIDRFFGPLAHFSDNDYDAQSDNKFTYSSEKRTDGYDSFGIMKGPHRAYPLANATSTTYYFKNEADESPITKDAYDALSEQEKAAYTLQVAVPHYEGLDHRLSFDQNGYWNGHVFGNYTNESYSFGVTMTFDSANNSFDFALLRDGEKANGNVSSCEGLLYVPGMALYGTPTFTAPTSYEAAVGNTALENTAFHTWSEEDQGFYFGQASAQYYSLHVYSKALNDMQRKQNHFADLASYFKPENLDLFIALPDEKKEEIYTLFGEREELFENGVTNTSLEDVLAHGGRAYMESVIDAAHRGYAAESFVCFDGYQVRTYGDIGLRARFTLKADTEIEGVTLLEVGTIVATAADRTTSDLTVSKGEDGHYKADGEQIESTAVYKNGEAVTGTFENEGSTHFACMVSFSDGQATKENLTADYLFRGYAVIEVGGEEQILYTDMYGKAFGGGAISVYDVSVHEANRSYETSRRVIATVEES